MNQTRMGSLLEAVFNTAIGFGVNFVAGPFVYPFFGWTPNLATTAGITLVFTVLSVVRGYVVRRFFNAHLQRVARRMAQQFADTVPIVDKTKRQACPKCAEVARQVWRSREPSATCECGQRWLNSEYMPPRNAPIWHEPRKP